MGFCLVFVGGACLGVCGEKGGGTYLISKPNLKRWVPPVPKVKVWNERKVVASNVVREGGRKVTVEQCEVEKVESLRQRVVADVEGDMRKLLAGLEELDVPEGYVEPIQVGFSAEVFREGERFFSRVRVAVGDDVCLVWSSMDFRQTSGVVEYVANGRRYYEGGGVSDAYVSAREAGCPVEHAALNGREVGFVLLEGSKSGAAWTAVGDVHDLYVAEKVFLQRAYRIRLENRKLADAWRKANPAKPKDIKIRFWKREERGEK